MLDRQVSVLERKLFWKLALVVVGDVLDGGEEEETPEGLMAGRGAAEMGMVEVGVDVPDEDA